MDRRSAYIELIFRFIHGDGSNTRRFIYGTDVADAVEVILHRGEIGESRAPPFSLVPRADDAILSRGNVQHWNIVRDI